MAVAREPQRGPSSIFLQDFVDVDAPADIVGAEIAGGSGWLAQLASEAGGDAESTLVRVGPSVLGGCVTRAVRVRLGSPALTKNGVIVPIRWEDAQRPPLFPVLDGDMEVAPIGPDRCRVVLYASYRPPLREIGKAIDDTLLHRVAESTVRAFLRRSAEVLSSCIVDP